MENFFVYGTLGVREVQLRLFGRVIPEMTKATLHGWTKKTDKEYPYLIAHKEATTQGIIIQLTADELKIADAWEEVPESYIRIKVDAVTSEGQDLSCWAYVAPNQQ